MAAFDIRKTWKNHLGNQRIDPLRIYEPQTIAEVQDIVRLARERGVSVRAVGSGHSWSDVALTEGFLLTPTGMTRVPSAGSMRWTLPSPTTTSSERSWSLSGPNSMPEPCVEVDVTPAIVCPS